MFRYIIKKIKFLSYFFQQDRKKQNEHPKQKCQIPNTIEDINIFLDKKFENCNNFYKCVNPIGNQKMLLAYINGFINAERLELGIVKPILDVSKQINQNNDQITLNDIKSNILPTQVIEIDNMESTIEYLYSGYVILFLEKDSHALCINIAEIGMLNTSNAEIEHSVRGPKVALTENSLQNLFLLTNRIKNPDFKSEMLTLGERTNTHVFICYLKGVAKNKVINQVKTRIGKICADNMLDVNFISEYISDNPFTFLPLSGNHERPDTVVAQILEGRVAILCDGSPFAITVPHLFIENIQNSEDYFNKPIFGTFTRFLRFTSFILAILLPALYIAFLSFEHQVTPFNLLIAAAAGQENIPFTSFMEAFMMILSYEILKEATFRMPKGIGQTVSIVGSLVLGEAAVKAGFTSNLIVIVLALTAIFSYINTSLIDAVSLYRFGYIFAANIFGLAGIMFLSAFLIIHMCSLTSFGVAYMSPLSPMNKEGLKDALCRFPLKSLKYRPAGISQDKKRRRNKGE